MHPRTHHIIRPLRLFILALTLLTGVHGIAAQSDQPNIALIEIDGTITPPMASYVDRGIRQAERDGADAIVLRIDTPGGLSSAMDDIVSSILESDVPVIAWVAPGNARAASAGVYITYAAHIAAMAPGTNIGSASPVQGDGTDIDETMRSKVMNDAISRIRNLAELRGRNVDWAISSVRDADNITATQALELNVINLIAPNMDTLLNDVDGMEVTLGNGNQVTLNTANGDVHTISMNGFESFLQMISDPTIAYLLLSFGSLGIFLELSNPGTWIPGIIGVVSFILAFYALGTLPVNWTGALLIGLAFALFFIDIFVNSFGLLMVGALTAFLFGSYMLFDDSVPGYTGVSRPVIWTAAALIVCTALLIGTLVLRSQRRKPTTGKGSMIGEVAIARQDLAPSGMVFLDGELWAATLDDPVARVASGAAVEVVAIQGLRLTVRATSRQPVNEVHQSSRREGLAPV